MAGHFVPLCTAILVLGGEPERDTFAVQLSERSPTRLDVFDSSPGAGAEQRLAPLAKIGRLHLSWEAVDTVTNFSTMIPALLRFGVLHVLLVTSDYHMPRAEAIASVMLGAVGISFEPRPVPSTHPPEPGYKRHRDVIRAWLWRCTGWDLRWLASKLTKPGLRGARTASYGATPIGMGGHEV
uniref:DUF218 domain-containing protein n=1 Tax=Alexandrium monilatum TaxID=311494 RepID=A0A7S4V3W3_9DINO|mmetsp:Transcript_91420/g.272802  ORF Transcript_91420/g.272802 Transcript_91420/m.272802 type:complete len:182 (+) Transcript_91420:67-612(+)